MCLSNVQINDVQINNVQMCKLPDAKGPGTEGSRYVGVSAPRNSSLLQKVPPQRCSTLFLHEFLYYATLLTAEDDVVHGWRV
jgi:hypothetical protein